MMDSIDYTKILAEVEKVVWAKATAQTFEPYFPSEEELRKAVEDAKDGILKLSIIVACSDDLSGSITYAVTLPVEVSLANFAREE